MAQLVYNLHIIALYHSWTTGSLTAFALSIVAGAAIFLASKFCIQVALFFSIFIALCVSPWYLAVLAACFALACIATRGRLLLDMAHYLNYAKFYASQLQQRFLYQYHSPFVPYLKKLKHCLSNVLHDPKALLLHIYWVQRNPLNNLCFLYPEAFILTGAMTASLLPLWQPLLALPLAGCVCMFLMETRPMMFLGEGERYMQYAAPTLCVLAAQAAAQLPPAIIALYCLYGLLFWAVGMAAFWLLTKEAAFNEQHIHEFFRTVNSLPQGNILNIGAFGWHCLYYGTQPFYEALAPDLKPDDTRWQPLYDNYPLPNGDLERVLHLFPTEYIITDTVHLERYKKLMPDPAYFERRCRLLHEVNGMCLYQVLSTLQNPSS